MNIFSPTDVHSFSFDFLKVLPLSLQNGTVSTLTVLLYIYFILYSILPHTSISMADSPTVFTVFVILILARYSSARDLRPADHGLIFQTLSPTGTHSSPEMRSFFNSDNSSPTVSSSSEVAMPKAITSSDTAPPSWTSVSGDGSDRVWNALKVASLACGVAGAILILVSGLIYVFKYRKQEQQNAAFSGKNGKFENDDHDNNKLQLVVRDPSS